MAGVVTAEPAYAFCILAAIVLMKASFARDGETLSPQRFVRLPAAILTCITLSAAVALRPEAVMLPIAYLLTLSTTGGGFSGKGFALGWIHAGLIIIILFSQATQRCET